MLVMESGGIKTEQPLPHGVYVVDDKKWKGQHSMGTQHSHLYGFS